VCGQVSDLRSMHSIKITGYAMWRYSAVAVMVIYRLNSASKGIRYAMTNKIL